MKRSRVGFGKDVHRFAEGRPLVLGGVAIDHPRGLAGHSDADVVLHAVIDALLGGAGLGDIGRHFPPGEEEYKDISSLILLERTAALLAGKGITVANVDVTVELEEPRLSGYAGEMEKNIASKLGCPPEDINVKATTTEGLGYTGLGEGVAAYAVALVWE